MKLRHVTPQRGEGGQRVPKGPVLGGYLQRTRGNRTQQEIAEAAGVDRSQVNAWENGRRGIEAENVVKMARALEVNPREILALADEPGVVAELAVQLAALSDRVGVLERGAS